MIYFLTILTLVLLLLMWYFSAGYSPDSEFFLRLSQGLFSATIMLGWGLYGLVYPQQKHEIILKHSQYKILKGDGVAEYVVENSEFDPRITFLRTENYKIAKNPELATLKITWITNLYNWKIDEKLEVSIQYL